MARSILALIVEDSVNDFELILDELRAGGFDATAERVQAPETMRDALARTNWDIVIADHGMPHFSAPAALAVAREHDPDLPFVIVSGTIGEEQAVAAMKAGAHDYVLKGNLARLAPAVARELDEAAQRRVRREAERRLRYLALHDDATGLPNRTAFVERTIEYQRERGQHGSLLTVAVGVEDLPAIADAFGARDSELLLRELAERIRQLTADAIIVARIGEHRLGVALPLHDADWRRAIEPLLGAWDLPFAGGGHAVHLRCRIGVAANDGTLAADGKLLQHAELALQTARRRRERAASYEHGLERASADALLLLGELQDAVTAGQLSLAYQPKVEMSSGAVVGFEALVRWNHPTRGPLLPGAFIPQAEQAGYIGQVTEWVLHEALRQQSVWRGRGFASPVAINLSAYDLDERFPEFAFRAMNAVGVPPQAIAFEVTESALMTDRVAATACLRQLRDAGCAIALDDFGVGYSALTNLADLPVTELKIDRSFVEHAPASQRDFELLLAISQLGLRLGLDVVGEGVERDAEGDALKLAGCPVAQGYLFRAPGAAREMEPWLQRARKQLGPAA